LENAKFVDFSSRETASFTEAEFFVHRYPNLLPCTSNTALTELEEEFLDFQLMTRTEIPESIWKSAIVVDEEEKKFTEWTLFGHI